jgi:CRP/FNR family cyclic AMP-dependent transcriptional regulator
MSDTPSSLARDFSKGHVLFREGDSGTEMFVVTTGKVSIEKRLGGKERLVAELGAGDFFGEMAVLNDRPRTATATCAETTSCIVIDKKTLESMIARTPDLAMRLIHRLARRLDGADTMVEILMHPDPRARVLLGLKTKMDAPDGTSIEALAKEVGATTEQVTEVAVRLRRLRLAQVGDDGTLKITDQPRFFEFLEFVESPRKAEAG